jgi:sugar (pentulose or hexulose) kinase
MKCLGIDVGSTSIKGAVLDLEHRSVGNPVSHPFPPPLAGLPAGWVEVDPQAVHHAVGGVLATLMNAAPDAERLYCSGQMGGVILVDADGRALSNYVSWRDQRTLEPVSDAGSFLEGVRAQWESGNVFGQLGGELQAGSATALLAWLREHDGIPRGAMPASIADYVLGRLRGAAGPMHVTHAIGMLDLRRVAWHRAAFDVLGLSDVRLPPLSDQEDPVGNAILNGRKLQLFGSYGDQQCALRGAGLQTGELSINISTGSQVSRRVRQFEPGPYQSRKYFCGDFLDTVTHLPAGRSLNVLVDLLTELEREDGIALESPWPSIMRKAMEVETTDLQVDLAFFSGPLGDSGRIEGITTENLSVGHLFHAAFRSMADNYAQVARRFGIADWRAVVLSGGLTQAAPLLRELIQQRFPVPLRESAGEETLAGLLDIAVSTVA